jgi:hypothetical protein
MFKFNSQSNKFITNFDKIAKTTFKPSIIKSNDVEITKEHKQKDTKDTNT